MINLRDDSPFDRETRIGELLRSEIPEEQDQGLYELAVALGISPKALAAMQKAVVRAVEQGCSTLQPPPLALPDTEWRTHRDRLGLLRAVRRLRGHVLVVRQSRSAGGGFYPVVDGHHPSAHGHPSKYATCEEACYAAEVEIE